LATDRGAEGRQILPKAKDAKPAMEHLFVANLGQRPLESA
jgi:hypothetical protein